MLIPQPPPDDSDVAMGGAGGDWMVAGGAGENFVDERDLQTLCDEVCLALFSFVLFLHSVHS